MTVAKWWVEMENKAHGRRISVTVEAEGTLEAKLKAETAHPGRRSVKAMRKD